MDLIADLIWQKGNCRDNSRKYPALTTKENYVNYRKEKKKHISVIKIPKM